MDPLNFARLAFHLMDTRRNQWKPPEELERMQLQALQALVSHAAMHVPHYRKTLNGLNIRSLDDLAAIPLTAKPDVQKDPGMFVSDAFPIPKLSRHQTSGSSGTPLTVYYSAEDGIRAAALRMHWLTDNGVGSFDRQANVTYYKYKDSFIQRLGVFKVHYLSMMDAVGDALRSLASLKPSVIISTPSFILPIAIANLEAGSPVRVRKVFTSGEMLTTGARELIKKSFSCSVSDRYGTIEAGPVAWECEKGSLHVFSDSILVEILDDKGNPVRGGESGEIVLTTLCKRSMPFIRYSIGDRAAWGPKCQCGRNFPVIKGLEGRMNGMLTLPSGRLFSATTVGAALRHLPGIICFQTIQERQDHLRIRVVKDGSHNLTREQIAGAVLRALPEPIGIEVDETGRIEPEKNGKIRDFISKIA
jgi:phenylacetate-CoA ligase